MITSAFQLFVLVLGLTHHLSEAGSNLSLRRGLIQSATENTSSSSTTSVVCPCFSYDDLLEPLNRYGGHCTLSTANDYVVENGMNLKGELSFSGTDLTCTYGRQSATTGMLEVGRDHSTSSEVENNNDVQEVYIACRDNLFRACNDCTHCTKG